MLCTIRIQKSKGGCNPLVKGYCIGTVEKIELVRFREISTNIKHVGNNLIYNNIEQFEVQSLNCVQLKSALALIGSGWLSKF